MLYELYFFYWDDDPANDEEEVLGVYSSYELAEKAMKRYLEQPRFQGKEEAFNISEYQINEENEIWIEGFS